MNPVSDLLKARSHDVAACLRQDFDDEILVQAEHYNLLTDGDFQYRGEEFFL